MDYLIVCSSRNWKWLQERY